MMKALHSKKGKDLAKSSDKLVILNLERKVDLRHDRMTVIREKDCLKQEENSLHRSRQTPRQGLHQQSSANSRRRPSWPIKRPAMAQIRPKKEQVGLFRDKGKKMNRKKCIQEELAAKRSL
jgi:hypothetical protein